MKNYGVYREFTPEYVDDDTSEMRYFGTPEEAEGYAKDCGLLPRTTLMFIFKITHNVKATVVVKKVEE